MFPSFSNSHIFLGEKNILEHINEIKTHRQNYSGLQPLAPVFLGACFLHWDTRTAMIMSLAQSKIRLVRSSRKIKFPRLWFSCDSGTLLCKALKKKKKDRYHCSQFSGDFRIWGYWFSIFSSWLFIVLCTEWTRLLTVLFRRCFWSSESLSRWVSSTAHASTSVLSFVDSCQALGMK